ncbi:hypothetical protein B0187_02880 [Haemophilus paracuniculus]|uniref:RxLR effector protein n=1 Tax=Haemophilus paracuniculus TaxID=734 RepID=A0A1T0ASZ4_9PAST|nr:hypothetical protein [Haemophilus paracuniculus]OOR99769.1 hypothetical protein B0187_02880 [Haemophilus paracuniculus]
MKWFKVGFVLLGLMIGSVANANDTFAPPVKLTPKLEKHFLQVEGKIVNNNRRMLSNVNRVKAGETAFFDKEMMNSLRYLSKEVEKVEKGNYDKVLLDTIRATGKGLIRNAEVLQVWLNHHSNKYNFTQQQYDEIKAKIENMGGYGVYIHNTAIDTWIKYYPND